MADTCNLADRQCVACTPRTLPLTWPKTKKLLAEVPLWRYKRGTRSAALVRCFRFGKFSEAIAFVNKVATIAEHEGHHPDFKIGDFNQVTLSFSTHAIHDLSENDFIMAAKVDLIV